MEIWYRGAIRVGKNTTEQKEEIKHRKTKQRQRILELLRGVNSHPTADWIYYELKSEFPHLSLGTVYRNLRVLKEQGEVLELDFGSTFSRYDGRVDGHTHFICEQCESVFDFDVPTSEVRRHEKLVTIAEKRNGFKINSHRLEFIGVCSKCQKKA